MKKVIYIDMDSFFVSCHQVENPTLKNKPVIVSGNSRRSIVCSASYEARKYQIKSALPLFQALKLCPKVMVVNINRNLYLSYSSKIFTFLSTNFTKLIENYSIDEYCLDVSSIYQNYGSILDCAQTIQKQILHEFDLSCSLGISFNKVLAKIASKLKKPQGISAITHDNLKQTLWPLAIDKMDGIGIKTSNKLKTLNIYKIGDLVKSKNYNALQAILGKRYLSFMEQAKGITAFNKINTTPKIRKSVGVDFTLEYDSNNESFLHTILDKMSKETELRTNKLQVLGSVILCGFKNNKNIWKTKQMQLPLAVNDKQIIYQTTLYLFHKIWNVTQEVRTLRITLKKITAQHNFIQLNLFDIINY